MGAFVLVTVSANPVERVKRAYDYTPPEEGLFDDDNEIPYDVSVSSQDGNSVATASVSGQGSASSNAFDFEKPEYTPKCCAHCTCS